MSKFGIFTFYDVKNYGAALQAYALQTVIGQMGYESEFVRYYGDNEKKQKNLGIKDYFRILHNNHFSVRTYLLARGVEHSKYAKFDDFCERYMKTSRQAFYKLEELKDNQQMYTGFICGSDMVWSDLGQNLDVYFLTFADPLKRISYAPSITGRDKETREEREYYKLCMNDITFLSCREQYGADYIRNLTGREAEVVLDPTLLLSKKQWCELLNLKDNNGQKPYILCYMFGGVSKTLREKIFQLQQESHFEVRFLPNSEYEMKKELEQGYSAVYGPREFVELFLNADFVFTNSYHGLLFSLIMQKPFYLFHRGEDHEWSVHEERMSSILKLIHQEGRFIYEKQFDGKLELNLEYLYINAMIEKNRERSLRYLKNALVQVSSQNLQTEKRSKVVLDSIEKLDKNKCTGCGVCEQICPVHCITMQDNREGFREPIVDSNKCIECHKCTISCQAVSYQEFFQPQQVFCGYGLNEQIKNSASGGVFITVAKWVIESKNGVVFGAAMDYDSYTCRHIMVDRIEKLYPLQNSKYVQSDITDALGKCRNLLDAGRYVVFSGTPCQIAALKKFLNRPYKNLFTMDIICHGVPSPQFFSLYLKEQMQGRIESYQFRHKLELEQKRSAFEAVIVSGGKKRILPGAQDIYYKLFLEGSSYREACYTCKFANERRVGDFTIGDCDSWRKYPEFCSSEVTSSILINTEQGKWLWNAVRDNFKYIQMDYREECIANHQLCRPSVRPKLRDHIYLDLNRFTWKQLLRKYGYSGMKCRVKKLILCFLK